MTKLKSCPFCGGEATIFSSVTACIPRRPRAYVHCKKCLSTGQAFEDRESNGQHIFKAIEAWNRRVDND